MTLSRSLRVAFIRQLGVYVNPFRTITRSGDQRPYAYELIHAVTPFDQLHDHLRVCFHQSDTPNAWRYVSTGLHALGAEEFDRGSWDSEGGSVITRDPVYEDWVKSLRPQGRISRFLHGSCAQDLLPVASAESGMGGTVPHSQRGGGPAYPSLH